MSTVNQGGQNIGWKYSTPLKAEYLNTFIAGITTPGLVTRPTITSTPMGENATITIKPFSMFVIPMDTVGSDGKSNVLVKVTTTNDVTMNIDKTVVAIGFEFSFADRSGNKQSQWYGSFEPLTLSSFSSGYKGIVVATVLNYSTGGTTNYSLTSQGADISDCLLLEEGWDPCCWLSLVSPRRMIDAAGGTGYLNQLEVRRHNDAYDGYISGHNGFKELKNLRYNVPTSESDPQGIRGVDMPGIYNLFNITTDGFALCNYGNTLPIYPVNGGVFAMFDATENKRQGSNSAFMNNIALHPVSKEDLNLWYNSTNGTLYIR